MSNEQRFKEYIKEHCKHCKNKDKDNCEIKIHQKVDVIVTKCDYYEKEDKNRR